MEARPFSDISYEQFLKEDKLMGSKCNQCGAVFTPPRPICIQCHSSDMEWLEMQGRGKLAGFTCISIGPSFMIEEGYEVIEASNGKETMEMILAQSPDCLLLDLVMPEMDGFGVLKAIQEKDLSIPVVVVSADIQDTSRAKCHELGAVGFLNKPANEDEIISAIQEAIT